MAQISIRGKLWKAVHINKIKTVMKCRGINTGEIEDIRLGNEQRSEVDHFFTKGVINYL